MAGGGPGALSRNVLTNGKGQQELPRKAHMHLHVEPGDSLYHMVSGSGGHGDPYAREPARVLVDVLDEKLSVAAAKAQYGVVIEPAGAAVDVAATAALRAARRDV